MTSARYDSEQADVSLLRKSLQFGYSCKIAPNRFLKAAMTERLASWDPTSITARGVPSDGLVELYRRWGEGSFGMILTGNIHIEYEHLEAAGNMIITRDAPFEGERFEKFREIADQAKAHGSLIVGQLNHAGRQVPDTIQKNPVSASDVQLEGVHVGQTFAKPHAASEQEIAQIVEGFAHAAEYLEKAGYDGVELHGSFGYLLAQFISPRINRREDKYGGGIENRARLVVEIAQEIRKRTKPDFILGFKLNSVGFQDDGFVMDDAKALVKMLEANQFDFVELSGGSYEHLSAFAHKRDSTKKREAFFLEFAEAISPILQKTKMYITGGFRTVGGMVRSLEFGDGVGIARAVSQEPYLVKDILDGKVVGTIQQKVDLNNFGLTTVIAGTQIRQISQGQEPIDLSKQENVNAFMKDMGTWGEKMENDIQRVHYGFVDITSVPPIPHIVPSI